jgi:hypothetical protein
MKFRTLLTVGMLAIIATATPNPSSGDPNPPVCRRKRVEHKQNVPECIDVYQGIKYEYKPAVEYGCGFALLSPSKACKEWTFPKEYRKLMCTGSLPGCGDPCSPAQNDPGWHYVKDAQGNSVAAWDSVDSKCKKVKACVPNPPGT